MPSLLGEQIKMATPTIDNTDDNINEAIGYAMANLGVFVELRDNQLEALRAIFRGETTARCHLSILVV